jgi:hypothetical protein
MQERAQAVYGCHDTHQGAIINDRQATMLALHEPMDFE